MSDDDERLKPATPDELQWTLRHALLFDGRRKHRRADGFMAELMAEHLAKSLEQSGFVVMKKPIPPPKSHDGFKPPLKD